jgi:hypothetical protein
VRWAVRDVSRSRPEDGASAVAQACTKLEAGNANSDVVLAILACEG